jgi:hypothetical protein
MHVNSFHDQPRVIKMLMYLNIESVFKACIYVSYIKCSISKGLYLIIRTGLLGLKSKKGSI